MSTFAELLANPTVRPPTDVQADAAREFAGRVSQSGLFLRCPGDVVAGGTSLILGVASYSPQELQLLDEIESHSDDRPEKISRIDVFDVLDCQSQQDFQRFLPGLQSDVRQTPVLGVWSDQQLQSVVSGLDAVRKKLECLGVL